jgi:CheY-like chemotaxis protein
MAEQLQQEEARKKRFVLVVDGDPRDLHATSLLAQNFGYTATAVKSVEEALEFLLIASPSLIITELVFPGRNGLALMEAVKSGAGTAAIPVIVQSSLADRESEERCRRLGCSSYVRKPLTAEGLYRAIQEALEATPRRRIRIATYLKVSIDGAGPGPELITQLSEEGLFIKTLAPKPAGSRHGLVFLIGGKRIQTDAVVLYTYGFGEGPRKEPGMGMQFLNLGPEERAVIQAFIRENVTPAIAPKPKD